MASNVYLNVDTEAADNKNDDETPAMSKDIAEICRLRSNPAPTGADRTIVALAQGNKA